MGDDAPGLVPIPPISGGGETRPPHIERLGAGLSRPVPAQAGLDLGHARSAAVGGLTAPLAGTLKFFKIKTQKTMVCLTRLVTPLANGPGAI